MNKKGEEERREDKWHRYSLRIEANPRTIEPQTLEQTQVQVQVQIQTQDQVPVANTATNYGFQASMWEIRSKSAYTFACLLLLPLWLPGQTGAALNGMIKLYPDGSPMSGVNIIATPGGSKITQTDGSFSFAMTGKKPGDKVYLTPLKGNYQPARSDLPI